MKLKYILLFTIVSILTLSSCEYDNYDAPDSEFKGQLLCDGKPFLADANRSIFKFFQSGFGKEDTGIDMHITNDGKFQQTLFSGQDYKLTLVNKPLPFELPDFPSKGFGLGYDSIRYHMNGGVIQNFEILPYYKITNLAAQLSENGKNIVATFDVVKMTNTEKEAPAIKSAKIYLGTSVIVDSGIACLRSTSVKDPEATTISVSIPLAYYRDKKYYVNNFRTYAYYRVAIELDGIPDYYLFSEIKKIEGLPVE